MNQLKLPIAAITDEFSPDFETALDAMVPIGMTAAELRVLWGKNILDLSDTEIDRAKAALEKRQLTVISIASPILKCVLPGGPEVDQRFQHDVFASKHTYDDQPRLVERAFTVAKKFDAKIIRVFSYWRTIRPEECFDAVVKALQVLARDAGQQDLIIGLENEHACNIGTAEETARVLAAANHRNLKVVWDPCNALVAGETPFPQGYGKLPASRIAHVHAKDCRMEGHTPVFGPLGTRDVDWRGQIAALLADGYSGYLSLETHWPGPGGDKMAASTICGWNLRGLAAA
jgi:sugar phosphate isomerase/epimerase